ncbi:MAG TPA: hypothetical protein VHC69_05260 [Polyangiaceae bacterium]|nr:hypothetical protein [Polyangiaceae bacterium]
MGHGYDKFIVRRLLTALSARIAVVAGLSVFFGLEHLARATDNFPAAVESTWKVSQGQLVKAVGGTQGCLLCHKNEVDSPPKTADSLVGQYVLSQHVVEMLVPSLTPVLQKMETNGQDSDGDTFSDYDEVTKYGTNPNLASSHPIIQKPPAETDAGASGADGGTVNVDAGFVVETPTTEQSTPPLLQTGCACTVGRDRAASPPFMGSVTSLVLLSLFRRRRSNTLARGQQRPAIHV